MSALRETIGRIFEESCPLEVELPFADGDMIDPVHAKSDVPSDYLESMPLAKRVNRKIEASLAKELHDDETRKKAYLAVAQLLAKSKEEALFVTDLAPHALRRNRHIVSVIKKLYECRNAEETVERISDMSRMLIHHAVAKRTILEDQHRSAEDEKRLAKEAYAEAFARNALYDPDLDNITAAYLTNGLLARLEEMRGEEERKTA